MKISEIAKLLGVTASKVRFLEAQGLVHPSRNPFSGYRTYNDRAIERLSFILQAQSFGFRIEELRRLFAESGGKALDNDYVIERMTTKLEELCRDIDRVCATRDRLIEGIDDVKARVRAQQEPGIKPHLVHPTSPIPLKRSEDAECFGQVPARLLERTPDNRRPLDANGTVFGVAAHLLMGDLHEVEPLV
jgi:MerR family transcriptional regulator, copper efflux regulator